MKKPLIVISDGMDREQFALLREDEGFVVHPQSKLSPQELSPLLSRVQGLVVRSATKVNAELINAAPSLRYIVRAGEGTDNIDKIYCQKKKIKVSNTPGGNNNSAAEHALALILSSLRQIPLADHSMKSGRWEKSRFVGRELWKKRVGIVGFGRIGQIVAHRLRGFEVDILFYDPVVKESPLEGCRRAESLEEVFENCEIVTLHLPLLEQTQNLITAKLLNLMSQEAIIVNASRGKIVNEDDLYTCLASRTLRGAAFDVFAEEPLPENSKLRGLDNFIMTPHLGASTEESLERVGKMVVHQLREFFHRGTLLNEVGNP